jgi:cytochrome P450
VDAAELGLEDFDPSNPDLFATATWPPFFARLRAEAPVHYCRSAPFGPYWSVTRFRDIQYVDSHHELFSSEPTIVLADPPSDFLLQPGFIAMDPPRHAMHRHAVQPAVAPPNLMRLEPLVRERVAAILDGLPTGEDFDWVQHVSIELTTQMLATLFDIPWEDRHKLAHWSDVATAGPPQAGRVDMKDAAWRASMLECLDYFQALWKERVTRPPGGRLDFLGLLARDPATQEMSAMALLGTLILLIVGGNDTTRNSISGGVVALDENPAELAKLRADPALVASLVPEIIRWQTPLAYMRRRATQDTELGGQRIRAGDKVLMWYISGNRDETEIENADRFRIDRPRPRHHLSFGFGIHRCMGNRLAEMQLRITWEEILRRFHRVELRGEPVRVRSSFVNGYERLPVRLHQRR